MKLLESKKLKIPDLWFVTSRSEIKDIPIGLPFIVADASMEKYIVRMLEYEVLYQQAIRTGYPFNFKKILEDNGFIDCKTFSFDKTTHMDFTKEGVVYDDPDLTIPKLGEDTSLFKDFVRDNCCIVDINVLKNLNVFPLWLSDLESAIETNIHNFNVFNPYMYNKKLDGMYGTLELTSPKKNLIIIDISGSIPRAVSTTCLTLSKQLCESFYADVLITGSISTLYTYEELYDLDMQTVYSNGMDNDQVYFKNLVSSDERHYETAIVFGDDHSPSYGWGRATTISKQQGQELCKWKVNKVISLHTTSNKNLAGYADWFEPTEVIHIKDWVKYLN